MEDHESARRNASLDAILPSFGESDSRSSANEDLLSGTGSIPLAASSTGSMPSAASSTGSMPAAAGDAPSQGPAFSTASAPAAPRYVRKRAPHRSQGMLDDLTDESIPSASYTHDSNISIGGSTPLSGMAYRRARSNISRVKSGSRYGRYLEIPKGRRSIFASQERARRRRSVLALIGVVTLLILAGMFIWNLMQSVLG